MKNDSQFATQKAMANVDDNDDDSISMGNPSSKDRDDLVNADDGDVLTKYEFELRLKEVRDYYRETNEISQEDICLNLYRTRFPDLRLNRCFVGAESTIPGAGRGLFASRDIEAGEIITLYPGDVIIAWGKSVGDFSGKVSVLFGNHVKKEDQQAVGKRLSSNSARSYEIKIGDHHSLVADPLLANYPAYLGHIANDSAMLNSNKKASLDKYRIASEKGHNAAYFEMEGSHLAQVATKSIMKGEEIFVSYGSDYWCSRSGTTAAVKKTKKQMSKGFGKT